MMRLTATHVRPSSGRRALPSRARWLTNAHLQTIFGNILPRRQPRSAPADGPVLVEVVSGPPARRPVHPGPLRVPLATAPRSSLLAAPTAILLHGLEGSAQLAVRRRQRRTSSWHAGCNVDPHEHAQLRRLCLRPPPAGHGAPHPHALPLRPLHRHSDRCHALLHRRATHLTVHLPHRLLHGRQPRPQASRRPRRRTPPPGAPFSVIGVSPAVDLGRLRRRPPRRPAEPFLRASLPPRPASNASAAKPCPLSPPPYDPARAVRHTALSATSTTASPPSTPAFQGSRRLLLPRRRRTRPRPHRRPHFGHPRSSTIPSSAITPGVSQRKIHRKPAHHSGIETTHGGHCAFLAATRSKQRTATTATGPNTPSSASSSPTLQRPRCTPRPLPESTGKRNGVHRFSPSCR